jgi:hypothetical protein
MKWFHCIQSSTPSQRQQDGARHRWLAMVGKSALRHAQKSAEKVLPESTSSFFFAVQFSYLTKFRCTCCFCYAPCACREGLEGVKVVVKTLGSGLRIPKNKDPSLDVSLYDYEYIDCRCEDGCFPVFANRVTIPNPESLSSSETGFICNKTLKIAFIRRSSLSESSW